MFLTLDITCVCELFVVRFGSCLASLLKVVNKVAFEFSDDKTIFLLSVIFLRLSFFLVNGVYCWLIFF